MIDITPGDSLVVGSATYPIKSVADWSGFGSTRSLARLSTVDAATLRPPALVAGKRGDPAAHLYGLKCTPLDPVDAEVRQRLALETAHELLQTFVASEDGYLHLILEDLKR